MYIFRSVEYQRIRMPTSGTSINMRKIAMKPAGKVCMYFQLASYLTCMKKSTTRAALVQAIQRSPPTAAPPDDVATIDAVGA